MKSLQRRQREKDVFQIQPSLSGVKCSNNISVPQVRVNMSGKWTWHNLWSHLSVNLKDKTFPSFYSIEWSGFNLQVNILRWIAPPPQRLEEIKSIVAQCRTTTHKFAPWKWSPHEKLFLERKSAPLPHTLQGDTM